MTTHLEQLPDGMWVIVDDATGQYVITDPYGGPDKGEAPIPPGAINIAGNPLGSGQTHPTTQGGTAAFDIGALKWLAALVLLWIILTALTEYSPNTQVFGQALAGLILLGALFYLGPGAMSNVKNVWTQTPGASPAFGPNPVPGA